MWKLFHNLQQRRPVLPLGVAQVWGEGQEGPQVLRIELIGRLQAALPLTEHPRWLSGIC